MLRQCIPSAASGRTLARRASCPVFVLGAALWLTGCGPGGPLRCHLNPDVQRPSPGVVIFLADGLPPGLVEQGCAEGWLPNIQKRFFEGGAHVRRAASTVPSITYAAVASMFTGVLPEQHQVVGNRWFDPEQALFRNYVKIAYYDAINADCTRPTIYERLQPAACANIQTALRRGVTYNIANWAVSGMLWFFWDFTAVDKLSVSSTGEVVGWANSQRHWPTILTYYFPALDTVGHRFGPGSPRYDRAIRHVDYQIGRVCDWLEHEGLLKTTYIVLLSDHGMIAVQPGGHVDTLTLVRAGCGRRTTTTLTRSSTTWTAVAPRCTSGAAPVGRSGRRPRRSRR
jgi:predicted AlkP superfamily pyrophosphatase or phosphodiesterase